MNVLEYEMIDILKRLKDEYGVFDQSRVRE